MLSFQVEHRSNLAEAGQQREVNLVLDCVAIGEQAKQLERMPTGSDLKLAGFLANRSARSNWVVFHVNEFEEMSRRQQ